MKPKVRLAKSSDLKKLAEIYIRSYGAHGDLEAWSASSSLKLMLWPP